MLFFEYMIKSHGIIMKNPVHNIPDFGRIEDKAPRPIPDKERDMLSAYMRRNDPAVVDVLPNGILLRHPSE